MPAFPRAPYSPIPTDINPARSVGNVSLNTPAAAFGANVGEALQGLGRVGEKAADEMFNRALALQKLDTDAKVKQADADLTDSANGLYVEYKSTYGKGAVENYEKFKDDLHKLRDEISSRLPTDEARKQFGQASRQVTSRLIFSAGSHSAAENKRYLSETSNARLESAGSDAAINANEADFAREVETVAIREFEDQSIWNGWSKEVLDNNVSDYVSKQWAKRLQTLAKTDPYGAEAEYKRNIDKVRYQQRGGIEQAIITNKRTIGSRNISDAVNQGWAPYVKPQDMARAKGVEEPLVRLVKEAQRIAGDDVRFVIGDKGGHRTAEEQAALVAKGVSKTYNSDHMSGKAVDLIPIGPDGKLDYKDRASMAKISAAMEEASKRLGIPLAAKSKSFAQWDPAHHSLPKDYDVSTAPKPKEESRASVIERAEAFASKTAGEDPAFGWYVAQRTDADYNRTLRLRNEAKVADINTVASVIHGSGDKRRDLPKTIEELQAVSPEVSAAVDRLAERHPEEMKKVYKALDINARGDVPNTPERVDTFNELNGMSLIPSKQAEFMALDVNEYDLTESQRAQLQDRKNKLAAKSEEDPNVRRALGILAPTLTASGITRKANEKRYMQFVGTLQDVLKAHVDQHKKPPSYEEVQQMGARLLAEGQNAYLPNWMAAPDRMFETKVPEEFKRIAERSPVWAEMGRAPTDEDIQRLYIREQYKHLYGGSAKSKEVPLPKARPQQAPQANTPQVPL